MSHVDRWKEQPDFALSDLLQVVDQHPWKKAGTAGRRFYDEVLAHWPLPVSAAIALVRARGIDRYYSSGVKTAEAVTQGHLRWMYTADNAPLQINGKRPIWNVQAA